jgi:hypothetical protein
LGLLAKNYINFCASNKSFRHLLDISFCEHQIGISLISISQLLISYPLVSLLLLTNADRPVVLNSVL